MITTKVRYRPLPIRKLRSARHKWLFRCCALLISCPFAAMYFLVPSGLSARVMTLQSTVRDPKLEFENFDRFIRTYENKIIFIETRKEEHICLTLRQSCAVESAALQNPDAIIVLLMRSPASPNCRSINELKRISNVWIVPYTAEQVLDGTPLYEWGKAVDSGDIEMPNMMYHLSDALRLAVTHKYSAIYADLDFIMLRPFGELFKYAGFVVRHEPRKLASGLLGFNGMKKFTALAMEIFGAYFEDEESPDFNGPLLLDTIIEEWDCEINDTDCDGVEILDRQLVYPIAYNHAERLFEDNEAELATALLKDKRTLAVHCWNTLTQNISSPTNYRNVLNICARENCPSSFGIADEADEHDFK